MADLFLGEPVSAFEPRPSVMRAGDRVQVAFHAMRIHGAMRLPQYEVMILDSRRRRVATLLRGAARPAGGVICVDWDGRDDTGGIVPAGAYQLRVQGIDGSRPLERTLTVEY